MWEISKNLINFNLFKQNSLKKRKKLKKSYNFDALDFFLQNCLNTCLYLNMLC